MVKRKRKSAGRIIEVNMTGVDNSMLVPEGDYIARVEDVTEEMSNNSGKPYLKWTLAIAEGPMKGQKLWHNTTLQPHALFALKSMLIAMGFAVPNSVMTLDLDECLGATLGVTVGHEVYEGKKKARVTDVFPLDEYEADDEDEEDEEYEEEDEEEEEEYEEEDEEEEEEYDLDSMNLKELLALAEEYEIPIPANIKKSAPKVRRVLREALSEDDI